MSTPYEPVLRHEPQPAAGPQCGPCRYSVRQGYCTVDTCGCVCKQQQPKPTGPDLDKNWVPKWEEPPAKPEDISTWEADPGIVFVGYDPGPPDPANPLDLRVPSFERVSDIDSDLRDEAITRFAKGMDLPRRLIDSKVPKRRPNWMVLASTLMLGIDIVAICVLLAKDPSLALVAMGLLSASAVCCAASMTYYFRNR